MTNKFTESEAEEATTSWFEEIDYVRNLRSIKILLPERPLIEAYTKIVGPAFEKIVNNEKSSMCLGKIRDALLPKLLFGEIKIKNAKKFVREMV